MTAKEDRVPPRGLRPSRAESEDLLDGAGTGPLHELLAAASGPAHREEIVGEAAATSAFLDARRHDAPAGITAEDVVVPGPTRGVSRPRTGWWRTPARLVAGLALALTTAGVAVGAAAVILRDGPPAAPPAPPASSASVPAPGGAGAAGPSPLPEAVRVATCGAWQAAGARTATARAADPAFTALVSAAGGAGNVDGYCAAPSAAVVTPTPSPSVERPRPAPSNTQPTSTGSRAPAASDPQRARTGTEGGGGTDGRAVGPPATPPGQVVDRDGPARGRGVGPPATPPGQLRAPRSDDTAPRGRDQPP
jgi:hypothetical protein